MNFKTLSYFILILGIIVLAYGGFTYVINAPLPSADFDPNTYANDPHQLMAAVGRRNHVDNENQLRAEKRKPATNAIIGGICILFLGAGIYVSANKKNT